jgi:hypothetical protein
MSNPRDRDRDRDRPNAEGDRPDKEQDLQATEDSIRVDVDRLSTVEARKSSLRPGDPEVDRLSDEAVQLADDIGRKARAERELGQDLA